MIANQRDWIGIKTKINSIIHIHTFPSFVQLNIHYEWNLSIYKRDFVVAWFYQTTQSLVSCIRVLHFESLIAYGSGLIRIIVKTISMNSNNWRANNSKYIWYILMYLPGVCVWVCVCESSDRCKSCNERVIKIIIRVFFVQSQWFFFWLWSMARIIHSHLPEHYLKCVFFCVLRCRWTQFKCTSVIHIYVIYI